MSVEVRNFLTEKIRPKVEELVNQWNYAENLAKKVENRCGGLPIISAINELRYAGRKLVDFHEKVLTATTVSNENFLLEIHGQYEKILSDIEASKHDSVDGLISSIRGDISDLIDAFGHKVVSIHYDYRSTLERCEDIFQEIERSRRERQERAVIYTEIAENNIDWLIEQKKEIEKTLPTLGLVASKEQRAIRNRFWIQNALTVVFFTVSVVFFLIQQYDLRIEDGQIILGRPPADEGANPSDFLIEEDQIQDQS